MVGAIDTIDNQSMVVMGVSIENEMPEALGLQFTEKLQNKHGVIPDRSGNIDLNGIPAYLVSIRDSTRGEVFGIHSLWFRLNDVTLQMLGLAIDSKTELLRSTALSVRTLTIEERNSIKIHTLRIREALAGESIKDFNARTGNVWDVEITAIMNNIEPDIALDVGQLVKITVKENYVE